MKKFLFTTLVSNDLGLLIRSLPIAQELRDRGHQVAFCNPAKAPRKLISEAGFDNLLPKWPLHSIMSGDISGQTLYRLVRSKHFKRDLEILISITRQMEQHSTAEIWNADQFMYLLGMWNENYVRADVHTWMEVINEYKPDVVVDLWNPGACIAARACHKPLITVIQADMHPESRGFIWWKEPPPDLPTPVPTINKILAELQLKPIRKTADLLVGEITLVVGMPETDPLPDTAHVTYIGSVLWQKPGQRPPDWFADLSTTQPVIWLYSGNPQYVRGLKTAFDSKIVICACIKALKDEPVQVVLSTGYHPLPKEALPLPSNFRHVPFVPALMMAERSDLMIHHGGYGSYQTGLFAGTPGLIIPTYSERESNARRIAAAGAGDLVLPTTDISGKKKHLKVAEIRDKVNRILSDPSFKENARRISERLRSYGGASWAASLIESYA